MTKKPLKNRLKLKKLAKKASNSIYKKYNLAKSQENKLIELVLLAFLLGMMTSHFLMRGILLIYLGKLLIALVLATRILATCEWRRCLRVRHRLLANDGPVCELSRV